MNEQAKYSVKVENTLTGDFVNYVLESPSNNDAQIEALHEVFKKLGWKKSVAYPAEQVGNN